MSSLVTTLVRILVNIWLSLIDNCFLKFDYNVETMGHGFIRGRTSVQLWWNQWWNSCVGKWQWGKCHLCCWKPITIHTGMRHHWEGYPGPPTFSSSSSDTSSCLGKYLISSMLALSLLYKTCNTSGFPRNRNCINCDIFGFCRKLSCYYCRNPT